LHRAGRTSSSGPSSAPQPNLTIEDIYAAALSHYRHRDLVAAQRLCRDILTRASGHVGSLVLLGDMVQQEGRNKQAVKLLGQALALDPGNAAAHDNIAIAYQALGRRADAVAHFTQALMLGLGDAENLVKHSAPVAAPLQRLTASWPNQMRLADLLGGEGAEPLANEALLMALLQLRPVHDTALERLLTAIRRGLLQCAAETDDSILNASALEFFCALAQQCFINEYVFALSDTERAQVQKIRERLVVALTADTEITSLDLIAAASYLPLYQLARAETLVDRPYPEAVARLLTQQIREPREEQADHDSIPVLTLTDDPVSLQVQKQYEENPYPRWTLHRGPKRPARSTF
jgi:tetratricopeptide (TPR) repeat protein